MDRIWETALIAEKQQEMRGWGLLFSKNCVS
jgi:hypothetical protein